MSKRTEIKVYKVYCAVCGVLLSQYAAKAGYKTCGEADCVDNYKSASRSAAAKIRADERSEQLQLEKLVQEEAPAALAPLEPVARQHGTIGFKDGFWEVECSPYVMIYLKRNFESISKGAHGKVLITGNMENARNLQWFRQRFPMPAPPILEEMAKRHEEHEATIQDIITKGTCPDFELAREPREYQKIAAHLAQTTKQLLLGDDVGLGKSMSAICSVYKTTPALIVTLTHLPNQWRREILTTIPEAKVWIIPTAKPDTKEWIKWYLKEPPDFIIISYSKLVHWAGVLSQYVRSVAFDECQELRHTGTARYEAASKIATKTELRIGMSATPIYNYGDEIHNIMDLIAPGCLGTQQEFGREWCIGGWSKKARITDPRAFGHYLRAQGLMLRRTRAEVKREIPPVSNIEYEIEHNEALFNKWSAGCTELAKILLAKTGTGLEKMQAGGQLDFRLRQATGIAKAPYVAEFVKMLLESETCVVLYGWHRAVYQEWAKQLYMYNPVFYTGTESLTAKDKSVKAFREGRSRVLILSLRSGAGLDGLQHCCRTVVFGELDWSGSVHIQCTGRVARDGQVDPVSAYYLNSTEGSDPVLLDILSIKRQQSQFVDPDAPLVEPKADPEHIKRLAQRILGLSDEDPLAQFCGG